VGEYLIPVKWRDAGGVNAEVWFRVLLEVARTRCGNPVAVYFFAAESSVAHGSYGLVFEAAKLADRLGFEVVWTPERHLRRLGGLFPTPRSSAPSSRP
jgi:hypothetical protein